jgi:hypothetical protein
LDDGHETDMSPSFLAIAAHMSRPPKEQVMRSHFLSMTLVAATVLVAAGPASAGTAQSVSSRAYGGTLAKATAGVLAVPTPLTHGRGVTAELTDFSGSTLSDEVRFSNSKVAGAIVLNGGGQSCQNAVIGVKSQVEFHWSNKAGVSKGDAWVSCQRADGWTDKYFWGKNAEYAEASLNCVTITREASSYRFSAQDDCEVTHIRYPTNYSVIERQDNIPGGMGFDLLFTPPKMPPLQ